MMCACVTALFGVLHFWQSPPPPPVDPFIDNRAYGTVSQYAPGLMGEVVANRLAWGHIGSTDGVRVFGAVLHCDHIGRRGWVTWSDGTRERLMVVDCANPEHSATVQWMAENNVIVEVGYTTAERRGFVGRGVMATVELD